MCSGHQTAHAELLSLVSESREAVCCKPHVTVGGCLGCCPSSCTELPLCLCLGVSGWGLPRPGRSAVAPVLLGAWLGCRLPGWAVWILFLEWTVTPWKAWHGDRYYGDCVLSWGVTTGWLAPSFLGRFQTHHLPLEAGIYFSVLKSSWQVRGHE